jgi:hypothetical protein
MINGTSLLFEDSSIVQDRADDIRAALARSAIVLFGPGGLPQVKQLLRFLMLPPRAVNPRDEPVGYVLAGTHGSLGSSAATGVELTKTHLTRFTAEIARESEYARDVGKNARTVLKDSVAHLLRWRSLQGYESESDAGGISDSGDLSGWTYEKYIIDALINGPPRIDTDAVATDLDKRLMVLEVEDPDFCKAACKPSQPLRAVMKKPLRQYPGLSLQIEQTQGEAEETNSQLRFSGIHIGYEVGDRTLESEKSEPAWAKKANNPLGEYLGENKWTSVMQSTATFLEEASFHNQQIYQENLMKQQHIQHSTRSSDPSSDDEDDPKKDEPDRKPKLQRARREAPTGVAAIGSYAEWAVRLILENLEELETGGAGPTPGTDDSDGGSDAAGVAELPVEQVVGAGRPSWKKRMSKDDGVLLTAARVERGSPETAARVEASSPETAARVERGRPSWKKRLSRADF